MNIIRKATRDARGRIDKPAMGACDACGMPLELPAFTNTCECGAQYNSLGRQLADRGQWGDEPDINGLTDIE